MTIPTQAAKNWSAIQESLYLLSLPDMRKSIIEGLATPVEECSKELDCFNTPLPNSAKLQCEPSKDEYSSRL